MSGMAGTKDQDFARATAAASSSGASRHQQKRFFDRYEWWFVVLGLIGNCLFFVGSVCFLWNSLETFGVVQFIAGSCFMLVSSAAAAVSEYHRSKTR
jgi:cation transport ATPase